MQTIDLSEAEGIEFKCKCGTSLGDGRLDLILGARYAIQTDCPKCGNSWPNTASDDPQMQRHLSKFIDALKSLKVAVKSKHGLVLFLSK